ncbi:MAG: radical SAM protein [Pseudobdellovibrionaceae bacterium]|nr:radical SAM protein [Bdellovibrionales bacterium]USN46820.1 MAG: radical SAM protein [Pseudobdellovibrionaceae bacterium]
MIKINEIFHSIQGESSLTGWPTVFIRTSGCHLRCTYCDTTYAYHDGTKMALEEILTIVDQYKCGHICVTGGEPLLQKESFEMLSALCDRYPHVSLETSGDIDCRSVDPRVHKVVDIKTPDSGEPDAFKLKNLELDNVNTEFKFVICSENDFIWAEDFVRQYDLTSKFNIFYSPSHEKIDAKWLAERILSQKSNVRLQLQLHKYIWSPDKRGV